MDTNPPSTAPVGYVGLKDELQKIAGIIEQYPDQLKQRAFELLINAYLGRNVPAAAVVVPKANETPAENATVAEGQSGAVDENGAAPVAEDLATESAPGEILSGDGTETTDENGYAVRNGEQSGSDLDSESRINANIENTTNMLRRRIRLRTMSQMPWHQSS